MWNGAAAANLRELIGLPVVQMVETRQEKYKIAGGLIYLQIRKIEYKIDEPEMWDISVDHSDHTFRTPFMAIGNTEVAAYGKEEGLELFRHAMAPDNPRALYIFESTAKGPNHWKDMWEAARQDEFSSRCIFVGWWANNLQRIRTSDPRWKKFGVQAPTPEENDLIAEVRELYNYEVTMEQIAWYRWQQTMPNSSEGGLDQNQPWTENQCFVMSGVSFFQNRLIAQRRQFIVDANEEVETRQEAEGKDIDPSVENGGFGYKIYQFYLG